MHNHGYFLTYFHLACPFFKNQETFLKKLRIVQYKGGVYYGYKNLY